MALQQLLTVASVVVATLLIRFITRLISTRRYFRKLQAQGLSMPPHSFLFGHIPVLAAALNKVPREAGQIYIPTLIQKEYPELGSMYYLDLFPFGPSMLVAGSPEALYQSSTKYVLEKPQLLKTFLHPITEGLDIVSLDGAPWKKWREVFNPGFSSAHLSKLIPIIIENIEVYCKKLDERAARKDIFAMKPVTDNLIIDIIGKVVLNVNFDAQRGFNQVVHSLRTQIRWLTSGSDFNLFDRYNPCRPIIHWYHSRRLNRYLMKELDQQITMWMESSRDTKRQRSITELALDAYAISQGNDPNAVQDPHFKRVCLSQIKIFLFAGHDTTSSTICYLFWSLSQNPDVMARLRQEHATIFGPDPSKAAELIMQSPQLISQLQYTNAVIKESFRLNPPSSNVRAGREDINFIDDQGRVFPTRDCVIWSSHFMIHHDPTYWPEPYSFIPERWLVGPGDPLYPVKGMWRPFETGPRNCIGQELAMQELRILLVLVCRTYNIVPAYDEVDTRSGKKQTEVFGEKAYQLKSHTPRDGLPVRVERI